MSNPKGTTVIRCIDCDKDVTHYAKYQVLKKGWQCVECFITKKGQK